MTDIHSTAIVSPTAQIGAEVTIGPYTVIGDDVVIGDHCWIGPHVVITGPTSLGEGNQVFQFSSLGAAPQDKKYQGEPTRLEIGNHNVIRESVTINRGTPNGGGVTTIGDNNLMMAYIHIAHDCHIGNNVIFSNNASLAGHVTIGDFVILSGFTLVHQFCSVGAHAFTGMGSAIAKDVPPYLMVSGNPAHPHGMNFEGLKRRGFTPDSLKALRRAYKVLYRSGLTLNDVKQQLAEMAKDCAEVERFYNFIEHAKRSILR